MPIPRNSSAWLVVGAGLAAALLAADVALTFRNTRELHHDGSIVAHTREVTNGLTNILSLATDMETGQRGFVITGDEVYLEPYFAALASIGAQVDEVQRLTDDNDEQQARFPELRQRIAARHSVLEEGIEARKSAGFEAAQKIIASGRGKADMDALRAFIAAMIRHEHELLNGRLQISERMYQVTLWTGVATGLAALAALIAFVILLKRYLKQREETTFVITEQAERLRTTLASIGDAVITTDVECRITNLNAVAASLTGWTNEAAVGQPLDAVFRIVNEDTRKTVDNPATRALRDGIIVGLANHTTLIAKDGAEHAIDDSAAPIRCAQGEIVGCVLVFRDITERRGAERALRDSEERLRGLLDEQHQMADELRRNAADMSEADRRKDEFLALLAHELRNPLAPIRHALEIVRLSADKDEVLRTSSEVMDRQVRHMVRLVDDLLDVSRISRGTIQMHRSPVDFADVIGRAVETCTPIIERAGHSLKVTLPPAPILLLADGDRLTQVFSNLIDNACKYSDRGCRISLVVEREKDDVVVRVTDTGMGIPANMLTKVFDMFTQVDRSLERTHGGLGIGLTLVRRLVEAHGGAVTASSDGPGCGSEFVVRLPIKVEEPELPEVKDDAAPANAPPRRILIVDDNVDSATSLSILLKVFGHETRMAHDGLEAIEAERTFRPEVVLLDIGLPKLNGYEVARAIRNQPWGASTLLIALTGWGHDTDRRKSQAAGFDAHLVKPVDHSEIVKLLAKPREVRPVT